MTLNELFEVAGGRIRRYTPTEAHAAAQAGAVIVDVRETLSR